MARNRRKSVLNPLEISKEQETRDPEVLQVCSSLRQEGGT